MTAAKLIAQFLIMISEHWAYVWGAARKGVVDCSGAFAYAFKVLGSWMYHGSNTMYNVYSYDKGKIGEVQLLPGMAVYKARMENGKINMHHVGLYIGFGLVIEAKGSKYGVILSRIDEWDYCGKLKSRDGSVLLYDVPEFVPKYVQGVVKAKTGDTVHMRDGCSKLNKSLARVPTGASVYVYQVQASPGWRVVSYEGTLGFMMAEFILVDGEAPPVPEPDGGRPILRQGDRGEWVKTMQNLLTSHGFQLPVYGADGVFGKETLGVLLAFQEARKLTQDGVCGASTWAALMADPITLPPSNPVNTYIFVVPGLTAAQAMTECDRLRAAYGACELTVG